MEHFVGCMIFLEIDKETRKIMQLSHVCDSSAHKNIADIIFW